MKAGEGQRGDAGYQALPAGWSTDQLQLTVSGFSPEGIIWHPKYCTFLVSSLATPFQYEVNPVTGETSRFAPTFAPGTTGMAWDPIEEALWALKTAPSGFGRRRRQLGLSSSGDGDLETISQALFDPTGTYAVNVPALLPAAGPIFLNDVDAYDNTIVVTNSPGGVVYKFTHKDGEMTAIPIPSEFWSDRPTGVVILPSLNAAIVGTFGGLLVYVDLSSFETWSVELMGADGLENIDGLLRMAGSADTQISASAGFEGAGRRVDLLESLDGWRTARVVASFQTDSALSTTTLTQREDGSVWAVATVFGFGPAPKLPYTITRVTFTPDNNCPGGEVQCSAAVRAEHGISCLDGMCISLSDQNCGWMCGDDTDCVDGMCEAQCSSQPQHLCCEAGGCEDQAVADMCVCVFDRYCCEEAWDAQCVQEAQLHCGISCQHPER